MRFLAGKQVVALLTLAVSLRLGAAVYWHQHWEGRFVFGDSQGYFELAHAIARGEPYQLGSGEQVFRAPGYPLLLAPVFWFVDGPRAVWAARVENCLFGALTVLAVAWWTGLVFGPRAAWIAGLITAIYPEAVAISVPVLSEAPFCLLVALNLAAWTIAWKRASQSPHGVDGPSWHTYAWPAAAGCIAGAATLVRPSWMLFLPFAAACWTAKEVVSVRFGPNSGTLLDLRRRLFPALAMLTGFVVVMLPWWVRNYRVTGHFVPTTLQVGASLYDGWGPQATGGSDMWFVPEFEAAQRNADAASDAGEGFEHRLDRRFRQAAWDWAGAHPAQAMQLAGIKFVRLWNVWPNEPSFASWPVRLAVLATFTPLVLLAAWGGWRARALGWPVALCWLPVVYFTLLHVVFVSSIRYRQPAVLGLIVLAAGCLANVGKPSCSTPPGPRPEGAGLNREP